MRNDYFTEVPRNIEAEQALLSSFLIDPQGTYETTNGIIKTTDFYSEKHRTIYSHIMKFVDDMSNLDITTLMESLRIAKEYDNVGGPSYIMGLMYEDVTAYMAIDYAHIVRHCSQLRRAIILGQTIVKMAFDRQETQDIISEAEKGLVELGGDFFDSEVLTAQEVADLTILKINKAMEENGSLSGVPTGFKNLDNLIEGLHDSSLNILAARPSVGKSALAMAIAENVAYEQDKNVLFVSLEMDSVQLCTRTMAAKTRIDSKRIRRGEISESEYMKIANALGEFAEKGILTYENGASTLEAIKSVTRRQVSKRGIDLLIVDYLQIMDTAGNRGTREQEISALSRGLKQLAMEINKPILALSQLSRKAESRENKRPILSDLRDSGAIEQDADTVMFLYREDYHLEERKNTENGIMEVIVAKNRNGPIGTANLYFSPSQTRFGDVDQTQRAAQQENSYSNRNY